MATIALEQVESTEGLAVSDIVWRAESIEATTLEKRRLKADIAETVLDIFERAYPKDSYVRRAIEVARKNSSQDELLTYKSNLKAYVEGTIYSGAARDAAAAASCVIEGSIFSTYYRAYCASETNLDALHLELLKGFFSGAYLEKKSLL